MTSELVILNIGFVFGFFMAWNIGANDVANSMASALGAMVKSSVSPLTVFHMARLAETTGSIADHAENTDDMMRAMVAR